MKQKQAFQILKTGNNVFLTGPPGSGKTFLLNQYIDYLKERQKGVAVTASTGVAATHMKGVTLHSWSGLGIKDNLTNGDIKKLLNKPYLKKNFKNTKVLVIDEISMLHDFQFDLINQICQAFKKNKKPFGGLQLVCSGDLFQLPPVQKKGLAKFVTESNIWQNMDLKICYLKEQYRQEAGNLLDLLNHIRNNEPEKAQELLKSNQEQNSFPLEPTKLYTHNMDVDSINYTELRKIEEKEQVYYMQASGNKNIIAAFKKSCLAPERLVLKKGAKVMFVKNNFSKGYVNGTIGKIIGFTKKDNLPLVETLKGRQIIAERSSWTIEQEGTVKAEINQIPLRLAWAITVHKSQGMNLEAAQINLEKCFLEGMGYVALSRLRSLGGLKLIGQNKLAFLVNKQVLELDKIFQEKSDQAAKEFEQMSVTEKKQEQDSFLASSEKEDSSTYKQTKDLVLQKWPLKAIAKARDLNENTILNHLEKLVAEEDLDIDYLKPEKEDFERIKKEFEKIDTWQLTPVRKALQESFSYQEIRIVRLFLKNKKYEKIRSNN